MDIKEYKQKLETEMTQVLFSLVDNWEEGIIEFKRVVEQLYCAFGLQSWWKDLCK